jgi:hypothetical protein
VTGRNCESITQQKQLIATAATGLMAAAFSTPAIALGPKAAGGDFYVPDIPERNHQSRKRSKSG